MVVIRDIKWGGGAARMAEQEEQGADDTRGPDIVRHFRAADYALSPPGPPPIGVLPSSQ